MHYSPEELEASGLELAQWHDFTFYEGEGCIECAGTGYKGRTAIHELLEAVHILRDVVVGAEQVARAAAEGVVDIGEHALERELPDGAAVHLVNAAKIAVVEAAARGLDHVRLAKIHVEAAEQALVARRQLD